MTEEKDMVIVIKTTRPPLTLWRIALLAFFAMCLQDILATAMVIAEANLDAWTAGLFDVAGWITGLICTALAVESIIKEGWHTRRSLTIIGSVSLANYVGTLLGVLIASQFVSHH